MNKIMEKTSKIYIAGHRGLVGSAMLRCLQAKGYTNIITKTHAELDLLNQQSVHTFFEQEKPEYVFLAAAKVGGIGANSTYPADFIYENTLIGFNVIHAAYQYKVKKLMNLGSTCIYPKLAEQPIKEESLLTGPLEATNDAYALAKISVIKLCAAYNKQYGTNFLSVMPTNLYGPGDNYDLENSHVLPAMLRKFHEAKVSGNNEVVLWGDGSPLREFLYSDDLAEAVVYLMEHKDACDLRNGAGDFVNIGSGQELTIKELAETVRSVVYEEALAKCVSPESLCRIVWDRTKPNGTPRKLSDISRLRALGFTPRTELREGIKKAYVDFLKSMYL
jgi:GDP-L-fucose synthase